MTVRLGNCFLPRSITIEVYTKLQTAAFKQNKKDTKTICQNWVQTPIADSDCEYREFESLHKQVKHLFISLMCRIQITKKRTLVYYKHHIDQMISIDLTPEEF